MKRGIFIIVACILANVTNAADFVDGSELYGYLQKCEKYLNGDRTFDNYYYCGLAKGYVMGVFDILDETAFCVPEETTVNNALEQVASYMKHNPAHRTGAYTAKSIVMVALRETWPCK